MQTGAASSAAWLRLRVCASSFSLLLKITLSIAPKSNSAVKGAFLSALMKEHRLMFPPRSQAAHHQKEKGCSSEQPSSLLIRHASGTTRTCASLRPYSDHLLSNPRRVGAMDYGHWPPSGERGESRSLSDICGVTLWSIHRLRLRACG